MKGGGYARAGAPRSCERQSLNRRMVLQEVAPAFERREYPLVHRHTRQDVVDQVRRSLGIRRFAGGAHAIPLPGECDQKVCQALRATGAGEAVGGGCHTQAVAELTTAVDRGPRRPLLAVLRPSVIDAEQSSQSVKAVLHYLGHHRCRASGPVEASFRRTHGQHGVGLVAAHLKPACFS